MWWEMIRFFKEHEFYCSCGCGRGFDDMDDTFIERLIIARGLADVPFVINSAIRCKEHNAVVGGKKTSSHLLGLAVDIACPTSYFRYKILHALQTMKFNRFGIGNSFIHVDLDEDKPKEMMWVY